jgi:hypothetical protein
MRTCLIQPILALGVALLFASVSIGAPAAQTNATAISVRDFGARADGRADDTPAFVAALKTARDRGASEVVAPVGTYRLEGQIEIPRGIALTGSWQSPHHSRTMGMSTGTVLLAIGGRGQEDGPPLILLNENSSVRGLTICYPDQNPREIVAYPWTIRGRNMHCTIENVTLVNSYQAIDFGTYVNELHVVRNVFGLALRRGVWVDNCTDIGRIENVHFNPHYWARSPWGEGKGRFAWNALVDYLVANGEAFIFGRSDWEYVLNTFCYGYRVGYRFIPGRSGIGTNGNFLGIGADGGNIGLLADAANPYGLLITNGEFVAMRGPEPTEIVTGAEFTGILQLNNCSFWGPAFRVALLRGPGTVTFNQCNFVQWDRNQPALRAEGGVVGILGCRFQRDFAHVFLGEGVKGATLTGNLVTGPFRVERQTKDTVEMVGNISGLTESKPVRKPKGK